MNEDKKKLVMMILNTLNQISVCGEENIDGMLACMQALKSLLKEEEDANLDSN